MTRVYILIIINCNKKINPKPKLIHFRKLCQEGVIMYNGTNPKALLSIALIQKAFLEELRQKSYEDITIKSLCKAADISRQTFYNVFHTKDDVLRKCIGEIFEEIFLHYANTKEITAKQSIFLFVQTFYKNKSFMELLIHNHLEGILTEEFICAFSNLFKFKEYQPDSYTDYQLEFYAGGLTRFLVHWMKDPNRVSADTLIDLLENSIMLPFFQ
ncbi:MAG: TetR/AcrR family transcriptional regulator [Oliverpabstia sp.]